jgi:3-oxoacyl-[acyl-carrier protein] reductase
MLINLKNKISLITGAGRGIGEGICIDLAKAGSKIIAVSRNNKNLKQLKKKLYGSDHLFLVCDLEKKNSLKKVFSFLKKYKIKPDIVVNNVGGNLGYTDPLAPVSDFEKVFHLNFNLTVEINRFVIPNMIKKKWGRIINISSISALENQGPPSYCAAKAALNAYTRSLGRYISKDNVIMTTVMPGAIMTKGGYWDLKSKNDKKHVAKYLQDRMAIKRFGNVSEISGFVVFLASDHASFCPGSGFLVDGGQGRLFYNGE